MNVKSIERKGNEATIVVEIDKELMEAGINKAYMNARKSIRSPGFRPGMAPRQRIEAMYGAHVFYEEERSGQHDEKVFKRELIRLESSLISAGEKPKIVFLHYPPRYKGYQCNEILDLLKKYDVRRCFYGHLHGGSHKLAMEGMWDGVDFKHVAADYIGFKPFNLI